MIMRSIRSVLSDFLLALSHSLARLLPPNKFKLPGSGGGGDGGAGADNIKFAYIAFN